VFWWETTVIAAATVAWVLILKEPVKQFWKKLRDLRHHASEPRPVASAVPQRSSADRSEMDQMPARFKNCLPVANGDQRDEGEKRYRQD